MSGRTPSEVVAAALSTILSRTASQLGLSRAAPEQAEAFDWQVYRATYRDLAHLGDEAEARRHYDLFGRREGRLATAAAVAERIAALQREHGPLPADFAWRDYVETNEDLGHIHSAPEAVRHYLVEGRDDGRSYRPFDAALYRSLYFADADVPHDVLIAHYREIGQPAGLIASLADLAARYDIPASGWLADLDVAEFALLNAGWAGPIANKREALEAMVREGFDRCAPIAFAHAFDAAYYAEANPGLKGMPAGQLYRRWLFQGSANGRPGTAADHLRRHGLRLSTFPQGFDWARYRTLRGVYGDSRWALLDHLVANNAIAAADIPVHATEAGAFLAALATTITDRLPPRGADLFVAASRHGPLTPADEAQWGNALARQGLWSEALAHYRLALDGDGGSVTTVLAATEAALGTGDAAQAVAILREAQPRIGGDMRFRDAVRTVIERAFADAWQRAERLYARDERSAADAVMEAIAAEVADWWAALDPTGLPVPPETPRRFVMLANVDLSQCTHYRVTQKQEIFAAAGIAFDAFTQAEVADFITALPGAAGAIFYRLPALPMNIRAIAVARALGVTSYYDIDDLIVDPEHYPEPIESYGAAVSRAFYRSLQLGVPLFRAAMAMCDYGIASTTVLAGHMDRVVREGRSFVLPNGIDSQNRDYLAFSLPKVRRDDDVVLFYGSGTKAHNSDFLDLVGGALIALMAKYPRARLTIVGYLSLDARFDAVGDRIVRVGWTADVASYWSLLAEADINMAVLAADATTDAKSEIKWLEAAALGVPSIVSATHRYREVLEDGVDALLVRTPEDWQAGLERLITQPGLRAALVGAARRKARDLYGLDRNADRLRTLLAPAYAAADARDLPAPRAKKRLLLVNIFFPPQTIGGSTRVARDNLDSVLASPFARTCDVAVVTTDNDNPVPYQLRVDDYRGVPVFRMSTPIEPNMEWRPFNPAIGALFGRVLDIWRPDLVHVHSIQRSTASILEECWARAIPYINTIHDAWWVSDYHFLVDGKGRLRQPEEPLPLDPPAPASLGEAVERRRRLRILLENSAAILSVSDTFTAIHHAAGYPRTRSVPNGVPPLAPVVRTPSASGRVRLAQIGSQTHHKGYHLIQAALMQGRFANLELTVVDHSRFGGRIERTMWGQTRVAFVGKTKQEDMHPFYGGVDVLLAPSVWPESFGLVAREAITAGLWVLASDRGAIGECVVPGVNGWVIDVATIEPLMRTFAAIDADPARYREPPPRVAAAPRTADDQARDLIAIYRAVLANPPAPRPRPYFMRDGFARDAERPPRGALAPRQTRPRWT